MRKQTPYEGGTYDKRPCRGEGFVTGKVHGIYVEQASDILINGLRVDWGQQFAHRGQAYFAKDCERIVVKNDIYDFEPVRTEDNE